ncbi:DUF418 domain-containing protein [Streptomyces sp. P38-E01]|uniref:DUF418 domain-containing protein n=2 Tax=Streptomyces tardus TaxID=2780544 RepID=A0A949JMW9_9ACTN|nr:DUF418 domain-containing protein [Streptomyces tardus]MBU7599094.1 DUF418 domain-containing protein [Streptomyces tardus]
MLDVLRGVAILGTLMTNIWIFTTPGGEWGVLTGEVGEQRYGSLSESVSTVFQLLANGKGLAMLTILFGVGLAIQYDSAARHGRPWPGRYRLRALFLFAEGTVHFVLVFAWDVLMGYAVVSLLVAWLLTRGERSRRRAQRWAAGLHLLLMTLLTAALVTGDDSAGSDSSTSPEIVDLYAHGSYLDQVLFRLENALALRAEPLLSFGLLLFLFLLGVRLHRAGAFGSDETGRRLRTRMTAWGLGLGVPLSALAAAGGTDLVLVNRYVTAPLVAVGYLGLIGILVERTRRPGPLTAGLTAVGRTALSCYVLQNVLCALLAYGFGAGLAARFADSGPWWVMGLWAAVCLVLVVFAVLWLRRHDHGPLEALQRRALRR